MMSSAELRRNAEIPNDASAALCTESHLAQRGETQRIQSSAALCAKMLAQSKGETQRITLVFLCYLCAIKCSRRVKEKRREKRLVFLCSLLSLCD